MRVLQVAPGPQVGPKLVARGTPTPRVTGRLHTAGCRQAERSCQAWTGTRCTRGPEASPWSFSPGRAQHLGKNIETSGELMAGGVDVHALKKTI